jgi:hypothetical protein
MNARELRAITPVGRNKGHPGIIDKLDVLRRLPVTIRMTCLDKVVCCRLRAEKVPLAKSSSQHGEDRVFRSPAAS